ADAAREARAAAEVRVDRRPPADSGGGGQAIRGDAGAHPPDRGEGAAEAAAPQPVEEAEGLRAVVRVAPSGRPLLGVPPSHWWGRKAKRGPGASSLAPCNPGRSGEDSSSPHSSS